MRRIDRERGQVKCDQCVIIMQQRKLEGASRSITEPKPKPRALIPTCNAPPQCGEAAGSYRHVFARDMKHPNEIR